ncbi:hypothetical protein NDU88_000845 [Pleurodeles waltl]|uniref:Uncharacterized protein n=1 Tax=Pleurodeles waltl TaxID=8319 RepID=A0AAV7LZB1_PLEWA|nr:hypothetical protein NDU88_000845 [Pleurodeles waltl]
MPEENHFTPEDVEEAPPQIHRFLKLLEHVLELIHGCLKKIVARLKHVEEAPPQIHRFLKHLEDVLVLIHGCLKKIVARLKMLKML